MKILETSKENLSVREQYLLTMNPQTHKMQDLVDQEIEIGCWAKYEDADSKGDVKTILSIMNKDGEVFGSISQTFISDFDRMRDLFAANNQELAKVKVVGGVSKGGRDFISCTLA